MWVRKSVEQIASERRTLWHSFRGPAAWFVVTLAAEIVLAIQGPRLHVEHWPRTWSQILFIATMVAVVVAVVIYVLQVILGTTDPLRLRAKTLICDSCHRVKDRDCEKSCECGGKFEDFQLWKWVDD